MAQKSRVVRAEFSSLSYKNEQLVHFAFRLDGEHWTDTAERSISFAGLAPGRHRLEIRSQVRGEPVSASRAAKGERGIWQRRYWEHTIRDENDFARHVDYVHINPLKHGLVDRVRKWEASSFHRYVKLGIYPMDWAGDVSEDGSLFGKRRES